MQGSAYRLVGEPESACDALGAAWRRAKAAGKATGHELAAGRVVKARAAFPSDWTPLPCVVALDERLGIHR